MTGPRFPHDQGDPYSQVIGSDRSVERPEPMAHETVVAALDIGTSKICCLIYAISDPKVAARMSSVTGDGHSARFLGVGVCKSAGLKAGVVIDLDAAERSVRRAVELAERMADLNLEEVHVSVSCGRLASEIFVARADVAKSRVSDADIARVIGAGRTYAERDGRRLLELDALGYRLDAADGIEDPRGMSGQELGVDLLAVTADEQPLRNLRVLVERCFLSVASLVVAPHASGLVATTADERMLGVTCVELGAGTTTLSMFLEGHCVGIDALAIGGNHITFDIARALSTPLDEAERIKTLNGGLIEAASDALEMISYPTIGGPGAQGDEVMLHQINRAQLLDLVRPRYEQILKMVGERIAESPVGALVGGRIVITGGASGIAGLETYARDYLRRTVRGGTPGCETIELPGRLAMASMSTSLGMIRLAQQKISVRRAPEDAPAAAPHLVSGGEVVAEPTYLRRVGQWFRESF